MMTDQDVDENKEQGTVDEPEAEERPETELARTEQAEEPIETARSAIPTQLGATRHVLAGFFAAGIAVAFLVSKTLNGTWNRLADNTWIAQHAPFMTRVAEDDRPTYTTLVGAVVGIVTAVYFYRRPDIRTWTSEVAAELAKVSWPSKKEVTNSTMVVIATGAFATVFLALLDRFWGFVTNLVYGS
jgi:preprotein translocase subunit SecE